MDAHILKQCSKCGEHKDRSMFNKHSGSRDGLRGYCKACHSAYSTNWIADNREHYNARIRADRQNNPDKYKTWQQNYRLSDPEAYKQIKAEWVRRNIDRRKAAVRRHYEKHYSALHAKARARQAQKLLALPAWADRDAMASLYREARKRQAETGMPHEVDHIVPLQSRLVCGLHCPANLQILPRKENRAKSNKVWPDMPSVDAY